MGTEGATRSSTKNWPLSMARRRVQAAVGHHLVRRRRRCARRRPHDEQAVQKCFESTLHATAERGRHLGSKHIVAPARKTVLRRNESNRRTLIGDRSGSSLKVSSQRQRKPRGSCRTRLISESCSAWREPRATGGAMSTTPCSGSLAGEIHGPRCEERMRHDPGHRSVGWVRSQVEEIVFLAPNQPRMVQSAKAEIADRSIFRLRLQRSSVRHRLALAVVLGHRQDAKHIAARRAHAQQRAVYRQ